MKDWTNRGVAPVAVSMTLVVVVVATIHACRSADRTYTSVPTDPRTILRAHISHGIGGSPLDSPHIQDSLAATMLVRARRCVAADTLRNLHTDFAEGGQLLAGLQADQLVVVREDQICTTFPILIHEEQARYARLTDDVAERGFREFSTDFAAILRLIRERDWSGWEYHFLWSQLFDSQFAWTELTTGSLVPPLGHLIAWVVYPDHPFRSGTNYYPDTELRDYWLMVTWRAGAANTTGPVGNSWEPIYRLAVSGEPITADEKTRLRQLGVLDESGQLKWPVLRNGEVLHDFLQDVARRYVQFLEREMPLQVLVELSGVDKQHAFAMAYHDVSWGILERLSRSGQIDVPHALTPGASDTEPSMAGSAALTPVYSPFLDLIRAAIESR
jgi:hypothetical protein